MSYYKYIGITKVNTNTGPIGPASYNTNTMPGNAGQLSPKSSSKSPAPSNTGPLGPASSSTSNTGSEGENKYSPTSTNTEYTPLPGDVDYIPPVVTKNQNSIIENIKPIAIGLIIAKILHII